MYDCFEKEEKVTSCMIVLRKKKRVTTKTKIIKETYFTILGGNGTR